MNVNNQSDDIFSMISTALGFDYQPLDCGELAKDVTAEIKEIVGEVPIWHKKCLTIDEAAKVYNIGTNRLRSMTEAEDCPFVLHVGNKRLIKTQRFDEYINADYCYSI